MDSTIRNETGITLSDRAAAVARFEREVEESNARVDALMRSADYHVDQMNTYLRKLELMDPVSPRLFPNAQPETIIPSNYSSIGQDILQGLGRRRLEANLESGLYSGGREVIGQIGINPLAQYELGRRENWSLADRLTNFDEVVEQLFNDYQVQNPDEGNYVVPSMATGFIEEISALEHALKGFDVSKRRISGLKNPKTIKFKHERILAKLANKKREIVAQYGIKLEDTRLEDTRLQDTKKLAEDIFAGKSAGELYRLHGVEVSSNHSWANRLENARVILNKVMDHNPATGTVDYFNDIPSAEKLKSVDMYVNAFADAMNGLSARKKQQIDSNMSNHVFYDSLSTQIKVVKEELTYVKNVLAGTPANEIPSEPMPTVFERDRMPMRYLSETVLGPTRNPNRLLAFDLRNREQRTRYAALAPQDTTVAGFEPVEVMAEWVDDYLLDNEFPVYTPHEDGTSYRFNTLAVQEVLNGNKGQ